MAEHQIETRILLRYDTYSNWMNSTVILKTGEAAVCAFQRERVIEDLSNNTPEDTPPAIGIKIGDNYHRFSELPWVQAIAADVYNWAKTVTKPTYTAQEIGGLQNYVENLISGGTESSISPRIYELYEGTGDNANKFYLRYKENDENSNWILNTSPYIDLNDLKKIVEWAGTMFQNYPTLGTATGTQTLNFLNRLNYEDTALEHQFVTAVNESAGIVSVTRAQPNFSDISGLLSVNQGGTGRNTLTEDAVLVGNGAESVKLIPIAEEITNNNYLVPNYLVKQYIDDKTGGITGAMHYRGEATVEIINGSNINPLIDGKVSEINAGDVVLYNEKEFVWNGSTWHLLGDESSYIIKGMVSNSDILENANIDQSKIHNLIDDLEGKVDVEEGKSLSSNDYTDEEKQKLAGIEENAQQNLIEHLYVNGSEVSPTIIEGNPNSIAIRLSSLTPEEEEKLRGIEDNAQVNAIEHVFLNSIEIPIKTVVTEQSTYEKTVNIELVEYTESEKQKLANIAAEAQVNVIESITVNGETQQPNANKNVEITIPDHREHENKIEEIYLNNRKIEPNSDKQVNIVIDENAVQFRVLAGARVPTGITATPYEDVNIDENTKKLELARIAATGRIYDIQNTTAADAADYLILNCGSSTTLVD